MGLAATAAKLLASLDLDTKPFEAGARRAGAAMDQMQNRAYRVGRQIGTGLNTAATNIKRIGIAAAGFLGTQVFAGVRSLEELERVTNATAGVIESTGGKAGVSAKQVRDLAQSLEQVTTADDKAIQSGENLLLTFTNIGENVFPQATKAIVDVGIAMAQGDVANADFKSSAIQVGKALNDPIKGLTALTRVGVSFTDQQKKQIERMVEAGDVAGAQKIILGELEREFGKAGEAAGKGFGADMRRFQDAVEDGQQALATGFLPIIRRVSQFLTTKLTDPKVQEDIRKLGDNLAGAFDQILDIGGKLPWQQIGDAFKLMGQGSKALLDAFTSLPPWVQTAVLTGWGLNKLTGGALGKLGVELIGGKGLFNRGSTPGNPMFTKEVGVAPGGTPTPVGARSGISTLGKFMLVGEAIGLVAAVAQVRDAVLGENLAQAQKIGDSLADMLSKQPKDAQLQQALAGIDQGLRDLGYDPVQGGDIPILADLIAGPTIRELIRQREQVVAAINGVGKNLQPLPDNITKKQKSHFDKLREKTEANRIALVTVSRKEQAKLDGIKAAQAAMKAATVARITASISAAHSDKNAIVSAIRNNRPITNVYVAINGAKTSYSTARNVGYQNKHNQHPGIAND